MSKQSGSRGPAFDAAGSRSDGAVHNKSIPDGKDAVARAAERFNPDAEQGVPAYGKHRQARFAQSSGAQAGNQIGKVESVGTKAPDFPV